MAVDCGIAMTGKMLNNASYTGVFQPGKRCNSHVCHQHRIGSKGPYADHRVVYVVIYVQNRGKIHVDPQCPELSSCVVIGKHGQVFVS